MKKRLVALVMMVAMVIGSVIFTQQEKVLAAPVIVNVTVAPGFGLAFINNQGEVCVIEGDNDLYSSQIIHTGVKNAIDVTISFSSGWLRVLRNDKTVWDINRAFMPEYFNEMDDVNHAQGLSNIAHVPSFGTAVSSNGDLYYGGSDKSQIIMRNVVSSSYLLGYILKTDGSVWYIGDHNDITFQKAVPNPIKIMDNIVQIASNGIAAFMLKDDGSVWLHGKIYGDTNYNNVGVPEYTDFIHPETGERFPYLDAYNYDMPTQITVGASSISYGTIGLVIQKDDKTVWLWRSEIGKMIYSGNDVVYAASAIGDLQGSDYAVFLKSDGSLWTYGYGVFSNDYAETDEDYFTLKPKKVADNVKLMDGTKVTAAQINSYSAPTYLYDVTDPGASIVLPVDKLAGITDPTSAASVVKSAADGATAAQKAAATGIDLLTLFAEEAVSQAASVTVSGNIVIDKASVSALQTNAAAAKAAAEKALSGAGVTTQRAMNADVKFKQADSSSVKITVDPSAADTTADNVRVETPGFALSFSKDSIKDNTADGPLVITVTESTQSAQVASADPAMASMMLVAANTKTYAISFNKPVTESVKVSLPPAAGNPTYQAVTNSSGTAMGGKYNPVTGKLEVKIKAGDTYTVRENKKNFSDITAKSNEMQEAINILAAKGIISGTSATTFAPDSPITRAEIAALITRTLSKLDPNANGNFTDVAKADWYYGAAGSAKAYGIMNGTSATTFAPKVTIAKDQITAVAARVLRTEMNYKDPANTSSVLSAYTDAGKLASWSLTDLALATCENLVVKRSDGMFNPSGTMTRGDAAIVLYRMFMKIW